MPFEHRGDLVRDVIDQRIRRIAVLRHVGHHHRDQRRDVLRLAGHPHAGSGEVGVKGGPDRITDEDGYRKADAAGVGERPRTVDLEAEPVANAGGGRQTQIRLGHRAG